MTRVSGAGRAFLPAVPEAVAPLDPAVHGLAHTGPAAGAYLVEGRRAYAHGVQREPGTTVVVPGTGSVTVTAPSIGRAANVVLFPGLARRDLAGSAGMSIETLLVAPDLPLALLQWTGAGAASAPLTVELTLDWPRGIRAERGIERAAAGVAVHGEERALALGAAPRPRRLEIDEARAGTVRVTITPSPGDVTTLLLAGGTAEELRRAFAAGAHPRGHAVRAAAGPLDDGLACATGIEAIDDGVAWARARLVGLVERARRAPHGEAPVHARRLLSTGLAAIAVGDRETSVRAGKGLRRSAAAEDVPSAASALLAAQHAATFGDASRASEIARAWIAAVSAGRAEELDDDEAALWPFAATALADGLLHAAPDALSEALRSSARALSAELGRRASGARAPAPSGSRAGSKRTLPMAGAPTSLPIAREPTSPRDAGRLEWSRWLEHLLAGNPSLPEPPSARPAVETLRRATARFPTDPDAAWIEWRRAVEAGLARGPFGPATWDDDAGDPLTAEILLGLVHGLLGIAPDAPSGRIRLAPRMPAHLTGFSVRGVTLGDASLRFGYSRSGSTRVFELEPEHGGVPPLIVLEPSVDGRVSNVRIDGASADLDLRPYGGRTVVPVQIPLDAPRTVEITTG